MYRQLSACVYSDNRDQLRRDIHQAFRALGFYPTQSSETRLSAGRQSGIALQGTAETAVDSGKILEQYVRTKNISLLRYKANGKSVEFNYERVVKGFAMPLRVAINGKEVVLKPSELNQTFAFPKDIKTFEVNRNFYIDTSKT